MQSTRKQAIAASAILLLAFTVGVFSLIRLGMAGSANSQDISFSSADAGPHTDESGNPTAANDNGDRNEHEGGNTESPEHDKPTTTDETGASDKRGTTESRENGRRTATENAGKDDPETKPGPETEPPRPAVLISSYNDLNIPIFSGDGDPPDLADGETLEIGVLQFFHFTTEARIVDVRIRNTSEPGAIVIAAVEPKDNITECRRGITVEPAEEGMDYLCSVGIRIAGSAEPGRYEGRVDLTFEATCTSKTGRPCESLPDGYSPSPDNPISITWISDHYIAADKTG